MKLKLKECKYIKNSFYRISIKSFKIESTIKKFRLYSTIV